MVDFRHFSTCCCGHFSQQISFEKRLSGCPTAAKCLTSVDGTDFRTQEKHPFDKGLYSHKFNSAGLRYEIAVGIYNGYIVWVNGPFPAGEWPDSRIVQHAFIGYLCSDEIFLADRGYRGVPYAITPGGHPPQLERLISKLRARHETVNRKMKEYRCLGDLCRHTPEQHGTLFYAVANLVQLRIETSDANWHVDIDIPFY